MGLPDNVALTLTEAHSLKGMVTLAIHRHDGCKRRETLLNLFFDKHQRFLQIILQNQTKIPDFHPPEDPVIQKIFDIMGQYFSIKVKKRKNQPEEYPEPPEENEDEQTNGQEDAEEEPLEHDDELDLDSCDQTVYYDPETQPSKTSETSETSETQEDSPENDCQDERLAFHMGGAEMMKPTPSPGPTWSKSPVGQAASPKDMSIDDQIAALEYFG